MGSPVIFQGTSAKFLTSAIAIPGSTSGVLTLKPAAVTTSYTITMPATQGGAGTVPTNDGAGNLTWQASGGGSTMYVGRFTTASAADANTELLIPFDTGTAITDYGVNNVNTNWSFNGAATVDATQVKFGAGALNMGVGHNGSVSLSHPGSVAFVLGSGDFTVDFWVYSANFTSVDIVGINDNGGTAWYVAYISGNIAFGTVAGGVLLSVPPPTTNTWHHFAIVRSSGTSTFYVDGVSGASAVDATNYNDSTNQLHFGAHSFLNVNTNCYIDEFQISNIARWTTNFTPPTSAYTINPTPEVNPGGWISSIVLGTPGQATVTVTTPFANEPVIQLTPVNAVLSPVVAQLAAVPTTTSFVVQTFVNNIAAPSDLDVYAVSS